MRGHPAHRGFAGALVLLIAWAMAGGARAADVGVPGAGTLLQDLKPPPSAPAPSDPGLDIEAGPAQTPPPSIPFAVRELTITGNTSFPSATLHALLREFEGRELTLPELSAGVARISDYYHAHGFPLARAVIPAQTLRDGVVEVRVIEARYGRIVRDGVPHVRDTLLNQILAPLVPGQRVDSRELNRILLSLAALPGTEHSATLQPGPINGTSDLHIRSMDGSRFAGSVALDNEGNRYVGRWRGSGTLAWYEPLRQGDELDLSALTSGSGLNYGRIAYSAWLNAIGTTANASYSALHYRLGDALSALGGHGIAQVASVGIHQPLRRAIGSNLRFEVDYEHKRLQDDFDAAVIRTHRQIDDVTATLRGDVRQVWGAGDVTNWSVLWTRGRVHFDDADAALADAMTARTQGDFSQWTANISHVERLGPRDLLEATLVGQWANNNLDPSQKMVGGGRSNVRAYDASVLSGDVGVQASIEFQHELARAWHGTWRPSVFFDVERLTLNRRQWTRGENGVTLRGAGLGLGWANTARWTANAIVAARLGAAPTAVGDASSVRAWFEMSRGF